MLKSIHIEKRVPEDLNQESIFIPVSPTHHIHMKHFWCKPDGPVCLLLHGSIENGKIFYTLSGKGFAPFLARHGFDVYVGDLRGRGLSYPKINRKANYGQNEAIDEDIPAMLKKIKDLRGNAPQHWVSHSWGGVLLLSSLSKFPEFNSLLKSMIFFSTKRIISIKNLQKKLNLDFGWSVLGRQLINIFGYLPALETGIGSDNETRSSFQQCNQWLYPSSKWIEPISKFNYLEGLKQLSLPPILSLTGSADTYLGHPKDVKAFLNEIPVQQYEFHVLGKEFGQLNDYDHINILTHKDAPKDHYQMVLKFIQKYQ